MSILTTTYSIYKVTNIVTGKMYIGQTCQKPERRWQDHLNTSKNKHKSALRSAIVKYGKDSFVFEVLETMATRDLSNIKEQELIKSMNTLSPNGYNLMTGGEATHHGDEAKKKISEVQRHKFRPVLNMTTGEIYESTCAAATKLNSCKGNITKLCKGKGSYKTINGNVLRYADDKNLPSKEEVLSIMNKRLSRDRQVVAYTPNGELVGVWNSSAETEKSLNIPKGRTSPYLHGGRKTLCYGYKIQFVEETK